MKKKIRKIVAVLFVFTLIVWSAVPALAMTGDAKEVRVVRVACRGFDGFIEKGSSGLYKGYAVAYLNKISQYTGWKYEFVEGSWDEQLTWLAQGKIDLICSAQKTEERERLYLFSEESLGTEETVVYARSDDDSIFYHDHKHMKGKKVGMLQEKFQNAQFIKHAQEEGVTYTVRMYKRSSELEEALRNGEVDMAVFGSITKHNSFKIVDRFAPEPYYFMTSKANAELMNELNAALNELHADLPYIQEMLSEEYYGNYGFYEKPLLTREEAEYIKNRKEPVKAGCLTNLYPLAYIDHDTGEMDGMYVALLKKIEEISGLDLELEALPLSAFPEQLIKEGAYDLIAGVMYNQEVMEDPALQLTDSFFSQPFIWIAQKGEDVYNLENPVVALSKSFERYPSLIPEDPITDKFIFGGTPEECLDAVKNGDADLAIMSLYVVNRYLQMDKYEMLGMTTVHNAEKENCLMLSTGADKELYSVLNKSIGCISENTMSEIIGHYSTVIDQEITVAEFLEEYKIEILQLSVVVVLIIAFLIAGNKRRADMRYERMEKEIYRKRAETDELTGLYNKDKFFDEGKKYLSQRMEEECRILFINVENFKLVNDLFGIEEGDRFLKYLAEIIWNWTRENNAVCSRIEADHFVVLTNKSMDEIEELAVLLSKKAEEYRSDIVIEISTGVYLIIDKTSELRLMCDRAHLAANSIKKNHLYNLAVYDDIQRQKLIQEQIIISEMNDALEEGQFCAFLQPKYNTETDNAIGAEALVRWIHPKQGVLSPGIFIPVFEKNGFIGQLDLFVYEEVCKALKKWKDEGLPQLPVSVNLSRVGFYNPRLVDTLCRIADRYEVPRNLLELEVTETAYARDSEMIFGILKRLRAEGFRILMDDFGSGYSSLNMLKEAPIDEIKLDMRFLSAADPYNRAQTILQKIIAMGNEMSLSVLAEGVETEAQKNMLGSYHCHKVQGYFYAKPMKMDDYESLLRSI